MDIKEISNAINNVMGQINASEKLAIPMLAVKAERFAQANPNDIGVASASNVLRKMASKETFISRADFNKLANNFHTTQTKLFDLFKEELGREDFKGPKLFERSASDSIPISADYQRLANPLLANALESAFDPDVPLKMYTKLTAERACKSAYAGLLAAGIQPKGVDVFTGQEDLILCQAHYETPKGISYVLVPIEIKEGNALLPAAFISEAGLTNLTKQAVVTHIRGTAGKALRVNGEELLNLLSVTKNGAREVATDVDLAAIRIRADKGVRAGDLNGIVGIKIDDMEMDVEASVPMNVEDILFSESMVRPEGVANFIHSSQIIEAGRNMLIRKMAEFGHRGVQVKVAECDEGYITYAIGISNKCGISVPVKIEKGLVLPPKICIADGDLESFSYEGISSIVKNGIGDSRSLAISSTNYHMKPTQLVETVKEACNEGNFIKAEDALNVLAEIDPQSHRVAVAHMMVSLNKNGSSEELKKVASQPVKDVPYMMNYKVFYPDGV